MAGRLLAGAPAIQPALNLPTILSAEMLYAPKLEAEATDRPDDCRAVGICPKLIILPKLNQLYTRLMSVSTGFEHQYTKAINIPRRGGYLAAKAGGV